MQENYRRVYVSSSAYDSERITISAESRVVIGASVSSASSGSAGGSLRAQTVSMSEYSVASGSSQVVVDYPVYVRVSQLQSSSDSRTLSSNVSSRREHTVVQERSEATVEVLGEVTVAEVASELSHTQPSVLTSVVSAGEEYTVEEVTVEYSEAEHTTGVQETSASQAVSLSTTPHSLQSHELRLIGLTEVIVDRRYSAVQRTSAEVPVPVFSAEPDLAEAGGELHFNLEDLLENIHLMDIYLTQAPSVLRQALVALGFTDAPEELGALLNYYYSKYNTYCTYREPVVRELCRQLDTVKGVFDATRFAYEHHVHLRRVKQLLNDVRSGDIWSAGRNPVFRALVKLYEVLPAISNEDLRNSILGSLGLSSAEELRQLMVKLARGERLSDREINALVYFSKLYDEKWNDLKKYGNFALAVSMSEIDEKAYLDFKKLYRDLLEYGIFIHYKNLDHIAPHIVDTYYAAVLNHLRKKDDVDYDDVYLSHIRLGESVAQFLRSVNILGYFASAVSEALKSLLVWLKVDEKLAEKIAMVGSTATVAFTLNTITVATGGLAAPFVLGLIGLSSLSTLAHIATFLDTPFERDALVNHFKENLPWIAASIGAAIATGYAGAKLGAFIEKHVTLPLLVRMYNKALDSGHYTLASKIRGFLENKLSQYTAVARLQAEDYEFNLYVDERGEIVVQLVAKGRWELVHTSKSLSSNFIVLLQDQQSREVLGGIVQRFIPEIKGSKASVERFLSNLEKLASDALARTGDPIIARDVLVLVREALKDARVLNALKTSKILRVVPTSSGTVIDTDVGAYVLVKVPGSVEPHIVFTSKPTLGALQLYTTLKDAGVNIGEFISVASKYSGAESWATKIGQFDVVFSNGKLVIAKEGAKLAEVVITGRDVFENLPKAVEFAENLQRAGLPYNVVKAIAHGYATGGIVPTVAPADVALPLATLYQSIAESLRGQGVIGERTVTVTTSKGVVTVNYAWYVGANDARAFAEAVKVLSTESMRNVAKSIVQSKLGAELGRGGVIYSYVLTVPADKAERLSNILTSMFNQLYELVRTGNIADASQVASSTVALIHNIAGKDVAQTVGQMILQALMLASEGRQIVFTVPATASTASTVYIPVVLAATGATTALTEQVAQAKATTASTMTSSVVSTMVHRGLIKLSTSRSSEYKVSEVRRQVEHTLTRTIAGSTTQSQSIASELQKHVSTGTSHIRTEVPVRTEATVPRHVATAHTAPTSELKPVAPQPVPGDEYALTQVPTRTEVVAPRYSATTRTAPASDYRELRAQPAPRDEYAITEVPTETETTVPEHVRRAHTTPVPELKPITPQPVPRGEYSITEVPTREEIAVPEHVRRAHTVPVKEQKGLGVQPVPRGEYSITEVPTREEIPVPRYEPGVRAIPVKEQKGLDTQPVPRSLYLVKESRVEEEQSVSKLTSVFNLGGLEESVAVVPVVVDYVIEVPIFDIPQFKVPEGKPPETPYGTPGGLPLLPRLEFEPGVGIPGEERYKHVLEEIVI